VLRQQAQTALLQEDMHVGLREASEGPRAVGFVKAACVPAKRFQDRRAADPRLQGYVNLPIRISKCTARSHPAFAERLELGVDAHLGEHGEQGRFEVAPRPQRGLAASIRQVALRADP